MTYKPVPTVYRITFDNMPGLEIMANSPSVGRMLAVSGTRLQTDDPAECERVFAVFTDHIVSWNIVHPEINNTDVCPICGLMEDAPLPVAARALYCLEFSFVQRLIEGWFSAIVGVSGPKEKSSFGGGTSFQEEAMRRLAELQSRQTLPTPNLS